MNEQLAIYLWSISETLRILLFFAPLVILLLCIVSAPLFAEEGEEEKFFSLIKKVVTIGIVSITLSVLIPSKKDLALVLLYPKIKRGTINMVQSDTAEKMKTVLDSYLDKQIKELQQ